MITITLHSIKYSEITYYWSCFCEQCRLSLTAVNLHFCALLQWVNLYQKKIRKFTIRANIISYTMSGVKDASPYMSKYEFYRNGSIPASVKLFRDFKIQNTVLTQKKKSRLRQSEISHSKKNLKETDWLSFSAILYVIGKIHYQNTAEKIAIWKIIQCIRISRLCLMLEFSTENSVQLVT